VLKVLDDKAIVVIEWLMQTVSSPYSWMKSQTMFFLNYSRNNNGYFTATHKSC
jgi:hypothetical protein